MNPFFSLKDHIAQFEKFSEHLKSDQARIVQKLLDETGHKDHYIFGIGLSKNITTGFTEPTNYFGTTYNLKYFAMNVHKSSTIEGLSSTTNYNVKNLRLKSFKLFFGYSIYEIPLIFRFKIMTVSQVDFNSHWVLDLVENTLDDNSTTSNTVTVIPSTPVNGLSSLGLTSGGIVSAYVDVNQEFYIKILQLNNHYKTIEVSNLLESPNYFTVDSSSTLNDDISFSIRTWGRVLSFQNTLINHIYQFSQLFSNNFSLQGTLTQYRRLQSITFPLVDGDIVIISLKIKKLISYIGVRIVATDTLPINTPTISLVNSLPLIQITNSYYPIMESEREVFLKIRTDSYSQITFTVEDTYNVELNKTFLSGGVSQAINSINCMIEIYSGLNEELIIY